MKNLNTYILEKLKLADLKQYNYHPQTKEELKELIKQLIKERGNEGDFNDIDTSKITDMSSLFHKYIFSNFNGNISEWDVSNVKNMRCMFFGCKSFNQDLSKWKINNKCNVTDMFWHCNIKEEYKPKFNK
jgi:hypothetical protein